MAERKSVPTHILRGQLTIDGEKLLIPVEEVGIRSPGRRETFRERRVRLATFDSRNGLDCTEVD